MNKILFLICIGAFSFAKTFNKKDAKTVVLDTVEIEGNQKTPKAFFLLKPPSLDVSKLDIGYDESLWLKEKKYVLIKKPFYQDFSTGFLQ